MLNRFNPTLSFKAALLTGAMLGLAACGTNSDTPVASASQASTSEYDAMMDKLATAVKARAEVGIPVPVPLDAGGGYTHEQHKQNAKTMYEAGMLYQQTGDTFYRDLIRDVLFDYADLYPTLDIHPEQKSSNKGKLFWQGLNEAWWLVYTIQGYETIRAELSEDERAKIEDGVFNPMADFLSEGSAPTFDQIHNHATWATAATGMTGYVLGQPERVEQALYGLDKSGEFGFLKQLDELFSPDGYYAEGPYYQRYALMPFVLFSQAIERNEPERGIFEHRDGIVLKAIKATMEQSYAGLFFPINDAIREKGINTVELKYGLAIAYERTGDPQFLGAMQLQNGVVPTQGGKAALEAIAAGKAQPFAFESKSFRDGPMGDRGALMVLRSGPNGDDAAALMKATTQGLGHGHFDKLGLLYYDNGHEIVADYGASRFLNVEAKNGGRYLPENETWAKQTVAHNALVVDETSHFDGNWREAQKYFPTVLAFGEMSGVQVAAAEIDVAYDGVLMQRVLAMVPEAKGNGYLIDIVTARSESGHDYDLPVHFKGQLIETSFDLDEATTQLTPIGSKNGYQHLWQRSVSSTLEGVADMSWLLGDQFYTMAFATDTPTNVVFGELGANDPNNNLRREQVALLRTAGTDASFVSVYERHGRYDSDNEVTVFDGSSVTNIDMKQNGSVMVYTVRFVDADPIAVLLADDTRADETHTLQIENETISWSGPVHVHRQ